MKAFRVKIPTLWRQAFPGMMLGGVIGRLSVWFKGEPFSLPNTLPLMALAAFVVVVIYYFQPTLAGKDGIKAANIWGTRKLLKWSDIQSVTFGRLYLLQPSLKLVDGSGHSYWIARDTKDLAGLYALTVQYAGANHPLAQALNTPLHAL